MTGLIKIWKNVKKKDFGKCQEKNTVHIELLTKDERYKACIKRNFKVNIRSIEYLVHTFILFCHNLLKAKILY